MIVKRLRQESNPAIARRLASTWSINGAKPREAYGVWSGLPALFRVTPRSAPRKAGASSSTAMSCVKSGEALSLLFLFYIKSFFSFPFLPVPVFLKRFLGKARA